MASPNDALASIDEFLKTTFDYVVVGGGTAGMVLATRLTEDPNITVGVLEAGKLRLDDQNVNSMGGNAQMLHNSDYDWKFKTVPQKHNANHVHHIPRGKMVGGSSGINFMAYVRPTAEDIDSWETQAPGWSWDVLEPYYRKSEMLLPEKTPTRPEYFVRNPKYHGESGPIVVSPSPTPVGIESAVARGLSEVSVPYEGKDPYGGQHLGFTHHLSTIDRRDNRVGRSYAAHYLQSCSDRKNLRILTEATALQIVLDEDPIRARGVKFLFEGKEHEVIARSEVIISASSIQSPKLLELSGIGNPSILQAAGVPCRVNLPEVGENLQEHPMAALTYELTKSPENATLDSVITDQNVFQTELKRLLETQDGMLAGIFGLIGFIPYASQVSEERLQATLASIAVSQTESVDVYRREQIERVKRFVGSPKAPAIEIVTMPCNLDIAAGHGNQGALMYGAPPGSNDCYTILVSPIYVMSRGSTHITAVSSSDNDLRLEPPRIDPALFSHSADVDVLAAGFTTADRGFRTKHLAHQVVRRVNPPPEVDLEDVDQARKYVQENIMVFNHSLGTCAMGRVVDERLRVKGVAGLRVVDCSVIPHQIAANPVATVYALAERAADLIREDM